MNSVCSNCKTELGMTCCELPKGVTNTAMLSLGDVKRLRLATGMDVKSLCDVDDLSWFEYDEFARSSTVAAGLLADQKRVRMKVVERGDHNECVLLSKSGCSVERGYRPYYCRIYPFWFVPVVAKGGREEGVKLTVCSSGPCFGRIIAKGGIISPEMFGTTEKELKYLAISIKKEAELHARVVKEHGIEKALLQCNNVHL